MTFSESAIHRLAGFLGVATDSEEIEKLTPDASVREFFRIPWKDSTAIVCAYHEEITNALPQIDVTGLFLSNGLPVAQIYDIQAERGLLIHEDFGDRILCFDPEFLKDKEKYLDQAIGLIARIQLATGDAYKRDSIASKLKFDEYKLNWELSFFKNHYFESLNQKNLTPSFSRAIDEEFLSLATKLESFATVLNHRDFHAANLMLADSGLRIIDHQDARIGAVSYDLVSLLLDRIEEPPNDEFLAGKRELLRNELAAFGLSVGADFEHEFEMVTVQRCLKAIGTFSNQAANYDKPSYLKYVKPMFGVVARAAKNLGDYPVISEMADNEAQSEKELYTRGVA
jgi:aminoglycoside/choline kinase family phosphotransferase